MKKYILYMICVMVVFIVGCKHNKNDSVDLNTALEVAQENRINELKNILISQKD